MILVEQNNIKKALNFLLEAVKIDDRDATIWFYLGKLCFKSKKYFLCRTSLEKCISINKYHIPAWNYLMELLYIIGDFEDCKIVVEKILKMNPKSNEAIKYQKIFEKNKFYQEIEEEEEEKMIEREDKEEEEDDKEDEIQLNSLKSFLIQLIEIYNQRNNK